jgi:hypothetical protein
MMTDPTEEHVAAYAEARDKADGDVRAGLRAVLELVQRDEIEPLEEQLAASERDVAIAGRALHAARYAQKEAGK